MPSKKDNLPLKVDKELTDNNSITYANEVLAIIAGVAASEVEGIASMCNNTGISDILGRNRNITRGVHVDVGTEEVSVDLYVIIEYGTPIQTAAYDVQESVSKAIETMTGMHVVRVDVHVQGVHFKKDDAEETKPSLENGPDVKVLKPNNEKVTKVEDVDNKDDLVNEQPSKVVWELEDEKTQEDTDSSDEPVKNDDDTAEENKGSNK